MGTSPDLSTRIEARNGVTNLALSGELDMATALTLETALAMLEADGVGPIVVDLRDLTFIDSSGLHALVKAHERSVFNGHRLLLVGASDMARRLFQLTGTGFLLEDDSTAKLLGRFVGDGQGDLASEAAQEAGGPRG